MKTRWEDRPINFWRGIFFIWVLLSIAFTIGYYWPYGRPRQKIKSVIIKTEIKPLPPGSADYAPIGNQYTWDGKKWNEVKGVKKTTYNYTHR